MFAVLSVNDSKGLITVVGREREGAYHHQFVENSRELLQPYNRKLVLEELNIDQHVLQRVLIDQLRVPPRRQYILFETPPFPISM